MEKNNIGPVIIRCKNEKGKTNCCLATGAIVLREEEIDGKTVYVSELEEKILAELPEAYGDKWTNVCVKGENLFLYISCNDAEKGKVHYFEGDYLEVREILWCNKGRYAWGAMNLRFLEEYPYLEQQFNGNIYMIGERGYNYDVKRILHKKCREKDFIFSEGEMGKVRSYYCEERNIWINFEKELSSDVGIFYMGNSLRFCDSETGTVYDDEGKEVKN